jgi:hypothetical protein
MVEETRRFVDKDGAARMQMVVWTRGSELPFAAALGSDGAQALDRD